MPRLLVLGPLFENNSEEVAGPKGEKMRYLYTDSHLSLAEGCPGVPCVPALHGPAAKVLRLRVTSTCCKEPQGCMGVEFWGSHRPATPPSGTVYLSVKSPSPELDGKSTKTQWYQTGLVPSCSPTHSCEISNKSLTLSGPPAGRFPRPQLSQRFPASLPTRSKVPCPTTAYGKVQLSRAPRKHGRLHLLPPPSPSPRM